MRGFRSAAYADIDLADSWLRSGDRRAARLRPRCGKRSRRPRQWIAHRLSGAHATGVLDLSFADPTSHETSETITNPDNNGVSASGWFDAAGFEIGDECNATRRPDRAFAPPTGVPLRISGNRRRRTRRPGAGCARFRGPGVAGRGGRAWSARAAQPTGLR